MPAFYRNLFVFALFSTACVDSTAVTGPGEDTTTQGSAKQKEQWASGDAPTIFTTNLQLNIDALPASGQATKIPWAGSYWPTYEDNINYKWAGPNSQSASKKYELAFTDGGISIETQVSRYHGIESVSKTCQTETECDSSFGEVCARRDGADAGRCVATWWGICHAWSPAAILLPEPRYPVVKNGVTFMPQDLKALGSLVFNSSTSRFVSLRCNKQDTGRDGGIVYDEFGRPSDSNRECRDTNAGTYHVLITNYLGIMKQSFVEDRVDDYEVWNQPLRGYTITEKREVLLPEANQLIGFTGGPDAGYRFNANAKRFFFVKMSVKYISESGASDGYTAPNIDTYTHTDQYEYVLETDASGKILGGEWSGASKRAHPDFLWLPTGVGSTSVAGGAIKYEPVRLLIMESAGLGPDGGLPPGVQDFTENANVGTNEWKHFGPYPTANGPITIEMSGTGDADLYVRMGGQPSAVLYDCRPYTGSSAESCTLTGPGPLFVSVHGYAASNVSVHFRFTAGAVVPPIPDAGTPPVVIDAGTPPVVVDAGTPPVVVDAGTPPPGPTPIPTDATLTATVTAGAWKMFGPFEAASGQVQVDLTGTGDADLYVRKGAAPTDAAYDCRPYAGTSTESCSANGPGTFFIGVKGYAGTSNVSLRIRFTPGMTPPPATHLDVAGTVALNEMKVFQVPVTAGRKIVVRTTAPADIDLYLKLGVAPTPSAFDQRAWTSSGNETLSLTPTTTGTLFVGVHGYTAAQFTVKTADQ